MNHRVHKDKGWAMHRFGTERGVVFVSVWADGRVEVYEEEAARWAAATNATDADFRASPQAAAARNRFGPALMLRIFRAVKAAHPEIERWTADPVVRRNPTGPREVAHGWR